ncbi:hypothetical protein CW304_07505 [Bacillus sp. UFRGS-B20]|nr:hypothetical protein CW304_07505 [Bacillus sp. UFRGS-B20]
MYHRYSLTNIFNHAVISFRVTVAPYIIRHSYIKHCLKNEIFIKWQMFTLTTKKEYSEHERLGLFKLQGGVI